MTEKNDDLTVEKIREQNRNRNKRHYERNKEIVKRKVRERYHRKKLDKELPEVSEGTDLQV
jgi:hypothetical protein